MLHTHTHTHTHIHTHTHTHTHTQYTHTHAHTRTHKRDVTKALERMTSPVNAPSSSTTSRKMRKLEQSVLSEGIYIVIQKILIKSIMI